MTDLASLFKAAPARPSQDVRYRQGTILTFDPITLHNTVDVGGTVMTDLPILGVGESTLLHPGAVVGILVVGGATTTLAIVGRLVTPGTAAAADAVSLESARTVAATVAAAESTSSIDFTDLTTPGPAVTVTVGPSGRVVVTIGARFSGLSDEPLMGFEISGANTLAASVANACGSGSPNATVNSSVSRSIVVEGLTPGSSTFTAKYVSSDGGNAFFAGRTITVQAL